MSTPNVHSMPGLSRFGIFGQSQRSQPRIKRESEQGSRRASDTDMLPHYSARLFQTHSSQPVAAMQFVGQMIKQFKNAFSKDLKEELLKMLNLLFGKDFKTFDEVGIFLRDNIKSGNTLSIQSNLNFLMKNMLSNKGDNHAMLKALKSHPELSIKSRQPSHTTDDAHTHTHSLRRT